jgi:uncharacterized phiE125 gp8 family phage protein
MLYKQCEIVATDVDSDGVESHPDDELLLSYLESAVDMAEDFTGLTLVPTVLEIALDEFPCVTRGRWSMSPAERLSQQAIELPRPPFVSLVAFTSADDSDGEIDPVTYAVDSYAVPARLVPVSVWPTVVPATNRIKVQWLDGYGDTSDGHTPIPAAIRQALLLSVADWYNQREDTVDFTPSSLPNGATALMRPKRVRLGMA